MKKTFLLIVLYLFIPFFSFAQNSNYSFHLGSYYTRIFKENFFGLTTEFKFLLDKRNEFGFYFDVSSTKTDNKFNFDIKNETRFLSFNVGAVYQFNVYKTELFEIGLRMQSGLLILEFKEELDEPFIPNNQDELEYYKTLSTDYIFKASPGVIIKYELFGIENHRINTFITSHFRQTLGKTKIGKQKELNDFLFSMGLNYSF
jgi:hypothetical protein